MSKNQSQKAKNWTLLAIAALAISGIFSVLLILGRTTDALNLVRVGTDKTMALEIIEVIGHLVPFETALIIHVNLGILVWLLSALLAYLTYLNPPKSSSFPLAVIATILITISPFFFGGEGFLNNYVPIYDNTIFKLGIALYLFAFLSELVLVASGSSNAFIRSIEEIALLAFLSFAATTFPLLGANSSHALYESLFWSFGHLLQFVYLFSMLLAWHFLLKSLGGNLYIGEKLQRFFVYAIYASTIAIFTAYEVESGQFITAFTFQMIIGGLISVPYIWSLMRHLFKNFRFANFQNLAYIALFYSLILFVLGSLLGSYGAKAMFIDGEISTIIPAHYHGSIIAVTVAFMGLIYMLVPKLGGRNISGRLPRIQLHAYSIGQILYIIGLAILGGHGAARKTVGIAQLDVAPIITHAMRGGGALVLLGGLLFVWIVVRSCSASKR